MTGFSDIAPVVREQTVKAVLTVVSKLSDRTINGELLKHLAKTANDEQPGIRTNTTICLGKLARSLGANVCLHQASAVAIPTKNLADSTESADRCLLSFITRPFCACSKRCFTGACHNIRSFQR